LLSPEVKKILPIQNPFIKKLSEKYMKNLIKKSEDVKRPSDFKPEPNPEPVILKISEFSREGSVKVLFNQPLIVPMFINEILNMTENTTLSLVGLEEIDVSRDILELRFVLNSNEDPDKIKFYIELKEWNEKHLIVDVNFTDPLIISKGPRGQRRPIFAPRSVSSMLATPSSTRAAAIPRHTP